MDSNPIPTTKPRSQDVKLPDLLSERLLAERDGFVKLAEMAVLPFSFQISATSDGLQVKGDDVAVMLVSRALERIADAMRRTASADNSLFKAMLSSEVENSLSRDLAFRLKGMFRPVRPMSFGQVSFMQALLSKDEKLVFGIGPTGTGKTHLAIAAGLNQLAELRVKHVVITRPHVVMEGEVVTPTVREEVEYDQQFCVFEDILRDLVGHEEFSRLVSERKIEIMPLGQMRGRSFNQSFIIVDEAQNMTIRKMRMAVTRIGRDSRMVVTGDPSHVDLRGDEPSGLAHILGLVRGTDLAHVHYFDNQQIIRNEIVARLEELYARDNALNAAAAA